MNTKEKNEYAVRNILQSIDNAATYCSYFGFTDLRWELTEMIESFKKRVEKKINDNI